MAQDNYNYSGSFEVEECKIITHHGNSVPLDLDGVLNIVSVYEDIMQGFLTANISFLDTNDLVLQNGIVGNEYCYLKLITPSSEDVSLDFTKDPLIVTSVRQTNEGQGRLVTLTLASREYMKNSRTRISQSFSGNMSEIVRRLVKEKQFLGSDKRFLTDDSVGLERIVIPNLRPLTAIQMIAQRAKTKKDSPFVFFETTKGLHFLSFDMINRQNTKTTFTLGTSDTYDNKPSKSSEDGKTVEDFHDSYLSLQSTSGYNTPKGSVHNINPYPNTIYPFEESSISDHLLTRNHKMSFLDRMGMTIDMVGNLSIQASDVIRLNVYKAKTDVDNEDEDLYDERLTGRYIITRLRHTFDFGNPKKHTIQATVIKDSVTKPYSSNLPPNPKRLI